MATILICMECGQGYFRTHNGHVCKPKKKRTTLLQKGRVRIIGWFGVHEFLVTILGETAKRYLCASDSPWGIRSRNIDAGEVAMIPKHAVAVIEQRHGT